MESLNPVVISTPAFSCERPFQVMSRAEARGHKLAARRLQREVRQRPTHDGIVGPRNLPMHNEFTAVFERDGEWYVAYCPEIPGANGQGRTKDEARQSLADAIALILEDRREDGLRGVPPDAERGTVTVR